MTPKDELLEILEDITITLTFKVNALPQNFIGTETALEKVMAWHNRQQAILLKRVLENQAVIVTDAHTGHQAIPASVIEAELKELEK